MWWRWVDGLYAAYAAVALQNGANVSSVRVRVDGNEGMAAYAVIEEAWGAHSGSDRRVGGCASTWRDRAFHVVVRVECAASSVARFLWARALAARNRVRQASAADTVAVTGGPWG